MGKLTEALGQFFWWPQLPSAQKNL